MKSRRATIGLSLPVNGIKKTLYLETVYNRFLPSSPYLSSTHIMGCQLTSVPDTGLLSNAQANSVTVCNGTNFREV